jgi:putative transposase
LAHHNTVFAQLLKLISRHEFEALANQHHEGQKLRKMSRWSQFVALSLAQFAGRSSLRDIVSNLSAQSAKLYHLGSSQVSRTSLARVNENQPYTLYEALFHKLLSRCQGLAPRHGFRFKNKLYSLDASTIDLCLSVFPWAKFRTTKGAVKLHVGLDHDGLLPSFLAISEGKCHDVTVGRMLDLPADSIVVMDRAYTDYGWFNALNDKGIFFVIRQKRNARYRVVERREVLRNKGLTCDQTIYRDPDSGKHYVFLTNNFHLAAKTIADIYKARWQIELFFKCIKQNLKIKSFIGTSKNAVLTQIWIAMCAYLMLAWIKFSSRIDLSIQQMIRLLQLNLFERRELLPLLRGDPPDLPDQSIQTRLAFS